MSEMMVDPERVREFASKLKGFSQHMREMDQRVSGSIKRLGSSWRDQEYARFVGEFQATQKALKQFLQETEKALPELDRTAEAAEEYLKYRR